MHTVETIGIISKPAVERARTLMPELFAWLRERRFNLRYDFETAEYMGGGGMAREAVAAECQLIIVLGGDGTLLSAARAVGSRDIPIFAVNLGGLGFLTTITVDDLYPELERALRGEGRIGHRRMLRTERHRDGNRISVYESLNDIVIAKVSMARMMDLEVHVDHHFVCAYKADGLIVATPTGSTAYSLSAGGPIIFPAVGALCITPICPHMLTNRPVIVPDTSTIHIHCLQGSSAYLTVDGQVGEPLDDGDQVTCHSSSNAISLFRPPKMRFFDVLRAKLDWGKR
jgi:NAD+ kinase